MSCMTLGALAPGLESGGRCSPFRSGRDRTLSGWDDCVSSKRMSRGGHLIRLGGCRSSWRPRRAPGGARTVVS